MWKPAQPRSIPTTHSKRATHRAPATPQHHGKDTVRPCRQAPKKSPSRNRPKQTSHSYTRKCQEGYPNRESTTPESPTACDAVCSDPETACARPPRDQLPEHDRDSPVSVAVSTEESELHVQDEASPSPQAASSRPLTRLRSQSAREGGEKRQLTFAESVNKSMTKQSEVTVTTRWKTMDSEEKTIT